MREFTLAIGIGEGHHTALQKTMGALSTPFAEQRKRFIVQWQRAAHPDWLAAKAKDGGKLMRASHNVLLAHEDKTYSGAFVASASIPWGQAKGDDDLGGYHLVWTRDMVQTATALLACGRVETARRALVYLACTQQPDGGFAQNFWIDGTPYWNGVQLDEVAFPLILAWRLWKAGGLGELKSFEFIERAAGFLVRHAPITHQERWEENAGYSPSTLAAAIAGLICAAEMARAYEADGVRGVSRGVCRLDRGASRRLDGDQQRRAASRDQAALHAHPAAGVRRGLRARGLRDGDRFGSRTGRRGRGVNLRRAKLSMQAFWSWCATACGGPTTR